MMRLSLFCTGEKYLFIVTSLTACIRWQSSLFKLKIEKIETANISVNASSVWLVQGFFSQDWKSGHSKHLLGPTVPMKT